MPNIIAYAVLLSWPILAFWLYSALPRTRAIICLVVVPYLLLPSATEIDLPAVPPINKTTMANLMLLIVVLMMAKEKLSLIPRSKIACFLLALLVVGPFITALQNGDPMFFPQGYVPGMSLYDGLSGLTNSLLMILPFLIARACLNTTEAHREILKIFMIASLVYSLPMLMEIRLSPQLHNWIYGFHPHSFAQQFRAGGFRPVVFLNHGLMVALFTMTAAVSAAVLWRSLRTKKSNNYLIYILYTMFMLALCKSLGPLVYGLFLLPLALWAALRLQFYVATLIVLIACAYPALRGAGIVPVEEMLTAARAYSEARAGSLQYRFENEEQLLMRAAERPLFGWGLWGRNHVHDPISARITTVLDGYWIWLIGVYGWLGFIATFGMIGLPILQLFRRTRKEHIEFVTAGLCLILAINMLDFLPNASVTPLTWMIAGSLLGYAERATEPAPKASDTVPVAGHPRTIL